MKATTRRKYALMVTPRGATWSGEAQSLVRRPLSASQGTYFLFTPSFLNVEGLANQIKAGGIVQASSMPPATMEAGMRAQS